MHTTFHSVPSFLEVSVSVAFFLGHPVYIHSCINITDGDLTFKPVYCFAYAKIMCLVHSSFLIFYAILAGQATFEMSNSKVIFLYW